MKKMIMKDAWERAKRAARLHGGTAKEWIAWGLTRAWKAFKEGKLVEKAPVQEVKPVLKGRMTEKQERFIASLLAQGKYTDNPVAKAFQISSLRRTITKKQASDLISELLAA